MWTDFQKGDYSALNKMLFFSAWNTDLIYHIFFQVCGDSIPVRVFIPWSLEKSKKKRKAKQKINKMQNDVLYEKLQKSYDFSSPNATMDE